MSIHNDIDRGLVIVAQIEKLQEELKGITARVEKAALNGKQIPLEDPERDGMQYLAAGTSRIVPVVITADFLRDSFSGSGTVHDQIAAAAGEKLPSFYGKKIVFKRQIDDGKAFRKQARETFTPAQAEIFIKACVAVDKFGVPKNAIKIDWARARKESEVG